jgi:hypothetical protein
MGEGWGLPDWCDPAAYGDTGCWSQSRWRWEFTRRRSDYRADFDEACDPSVKHFAEVRELRKQRDGLEGRYLAPNEPGFQCVTTTDQFSRYGIVLLNPRISEQPSHILQFQPNPFRSGMVVGQGQPFGEQAATEVPEGAVSVKFDLDRPIEQQLDAWRGMLLAWQQMRHGKIIRRRTHPNKWLRYLRVLDGREAGASWSAIADAVFEPMVERTPQAAQRMHKDAQALAFNWPS